MQENNTNNNQFINQNQINAASNQTNPYLVKQPQQHPTQPQQHQQGNPYAPPSSNPTINQPQGNTGHQFTYQTPQDKRIPPPNLFDDSQRQINNQMNPYTNGGQNQNLAQNQPINGQGGPQGGQNLPQNGQFGAGSPAGGYQPQQPQANNGPQNGYQGGNQGNQPTQNYQQYGLKPPNNSFGAAGNSQGTGGFQNGIAHSFGGNPQNRQPGQTQAQNQPTRGTPGPVTYRRLLGPPGGATTNPAQRTTPIRQAAPGEFNQPTNQNQNQPIVRRPYQLGGGTTTQPGTTNGGRVRINNPTGATGGYQRLPQTNQRVVGNPAINSRPNSPGQATTTRPLGAGKTNTPFIRNPQPQQQGATLATRPGAQQVYQAQPQQIQPRSRLQHSVEEYIQPTTIAQGQARGRVISTQPRISLNPSGHNVINPSTSQSIRVAPAGIKTKAQPLSGRILPNIQTVNTTAAGTPLSNVSSVYRRPSNRFVAPAGQILTPQGPSTRSIITTPTRPVVVNQAPVYPSQPTVVQQAPLQQRPARTYGSPPISPVQYAVGQPTIIERKLVYTDPESGARMMKVCTPNGTIKRVEILDMPPNEFYMNTEIPPEIQSMINDAIAEFSNPIVEEFDCEGDPCKIEASRDGGSVYYGGDSFAVMNRKGGYLVNEGIVNPERRFCTVKSLPNSDIIVNDFNQGWDLILMDDNFNEKQKLEGLGNPVPSYHRVMKTRTGDDDDYMVWLRGGSDVSIVNTQEFQARHINNFFAYRDRDVRALAAAIDRDATKLVGIGYLPYEDNRQTVHVYSGLNEAAVYDGDRIIPGCGAWLCLEVSSFGEVFFLGGAETLDFEFGDAFLAAITFDESAEVVNYARYGPDMGLHCVNCLKRHPDGNLLFAGCLGKIAILLWAGDQFHLIKVIPNIVNKPVSDLSYAAGALYGVCEFNRGLVCYFDDRYLKQRTGPAPPVGLETGRRLSGGSAQMDGLVEPRHRDMFRNYDFSQINLPGVEMTRVQVSPDQQYIYTGRRQMKALERQGDSYRLLNVGSNVQPFIDAKLLDTGEVITFDEATSDLVMYDPSLKEINRLKGQRAINLAGNSIVTTLYHDDDKVYIWMLGDGSIGLCNPNTFTYSLISNFFGTPAEDITPFTAIASPETRKALGLYIHYERGNEIFFVYLRGDEPPIRRRQAEVLRNTGTTLCMETSVDDNLVFCGGSDIKDINDGVAKLFAITFDRNLELVSEAILPHNSVRTMGVSCMKRMRNMDVLFCGANASVFVVEWTGRRFAILNQVEGIHSRLVTGIDAAGSTIFTVCKDDGYINRIEFFA